MVFNMQLIVPAVLSVGLVSGAPSTTTPFFETDADPFLGRVVASRACIHDDIQAALEDSCLRERAEDGVEDRLATVEAQLRGTYAALPKNEQGRLGSQGVRYLLHRHFLHQHAWLVRGLRPDGGAWSKAFPMEEVKAWAPADVQAVISEHLNHRGLTLRESAVLATLLENQVNGEAVKIFRAVWQAHGLPLEEAVDAATLRAVVEDFAMVFLLTLEHDKISAEVLATARASFEEVYPEWDHTKQFLIETQEKVTEGASTGLRLAVGNQIVIRMIQQHGAWQHKECQALKQDLIKLESSRPGRVGLNTFYAASTEKRLFTEGVPYLRQIGALDESDEARPSVIIPNYLNSPANFLTDGGLFDVACIDECEGVFQDIERRVGGPTATVEELVSIVREFSSTDVLSDALIERLREVAALSAGQIHLHGRLFALWLHHAYPRDCPYPAEAGKTRPVHPIAYLEETGVNSEATPEELEKARRLSTLPFAASNVPLPWDLHEELLLADTESSSDVWQWAAGCDVLAVAAMVAMGFLVVGAVVNGSKGRKHHAASD